MMGHYMLCSETKFKDHAKYRSEMADGVYGALKDFRASDLPKGTLTCMKEQLYCFLHENICGENTANITEMVKFIDHLMRDHFKILVDIKTVETVLSALKVFCPVQHEKRSCPAKPKQKRDLALFDIVGFAKTDLKTGGKLLSLRKRAFDPPEMMRVFDEFVCIPERLVKMADYYEDDVGNLEYDRGWFIELVSSIWCCLSKNFVKNYFSMPE